MLRYRPRARRGGSGRIFGSGVNGVNGVNISQDRRLGAFHEQLTLADRAWTAGPAAHAPTVVDTPLTGPPPPAPPRQGPTRAEARRAAKRRRARVADPENLKLRRLVPRALVVAFLAGGTTAFVTHDKAVRLDVDGTPAPCTPSPTTSPSSWRTRASPSAPTTTSPRPLALTWPTATRSPSATAAPSTSPSTATTAGSGRPPTPWPKPCARSGSGRRGVPLRLPSTRIARTGLLLTVRTERTVTFMADGQERTLRTNAATVHEALAQAGITLEGLDATSVDPASFPRDGQTVSVLRITDTREVHEESVPYAVERSDDPELFRGVERVERAGRNGVRRVTYAVRTVNGVRQTPRRTGVELVHRPVSRVVRTGTRQRPAAVTGADGLNWSALAACESGGRAGAVDPSGTYGGLYQFDTQTWQSLGGSGRPQDAPAAEQTYRAKKLYVQRGASPWPHCGRRLTG